jgi:LDH2 family malate/lactate/ureidoglycolate dehydrogenase
MAGHKGYAIALMMDVLAGVLTGSAFGAVVGGPYQAERRSGAAHLFLALSIEAFLAPAEFDARVERLIGELKSAPRARGVDEIHYPGAALRRPRADGRQRGAAQALPQRLGERAGDRGAVRGGRLPPRAVPHAADRRRLVAEATG